MIDLNNDVWIFGQYTPQLYKNNNITQPMLIEHFKVYQVSAGKRYTMMIATLI